MEKILDKLLAFIAGLLGGVTQEHLLWTNPSPASQFPPKTISVDLTNYNFVKIVYYTDTSRGLHGVTTLEKGAGFAHLKFNGYYNDARPASMTNDGVTFYDAIRYKAYANPSSGVDYLNSNIIPYKIYGIKRIGGGYNLKTLIRRIFRKGGVRNAG